jgi:gluconate kinase
MGDYRNPGGAGNFSFEVRLSRNRPWTPPLVRAIAYLKADRALLEQRLLHRTDHVLKADLLDSQLETLEEPSDVLVLDASDTLPRLVQQLRTAFDL